MKTSKKITLIIATALVVCGLIIFFVAAAALDFDFTKVNSAEYVTNTHTVDEQFANISIDTDEFDIRFAPSDDGTCKVECRESDKVYNTVTVKNNTLTVERHDERSWYERHFGFFVGDMSITVYLPEREYGNVDLETSVGDVNIPESFTFDQLIIETDTGNITADANIADILSVKSDTGHIGLSGIEVNSMDLDSGTGDISVNSANVTDEIKLNTDTGRVMLSNARCHSLTAESSTGDISFSDVVVSGDCYMESDTGRIELLGFDAEEIFIETDTGDVFGTLLTEKVFIAESDTGDVSVPKTASGGRCEIISDTGNIEIEIA
ncbi:MAG: DUF4097 family beta strand repeat-containing protein [Oscillospiraceae bacterium]|nr:DUF4097 family beta strand repeat-containing protein [Oscillospiraceae bacterium]